MENVLYSDAGVCPVRDWLAQQSRNIQLKWLARFELLAQSPSDSPAIFVDQLPDGFWALCASCEGKKSRILFFIHKRIAVLCMPLYKDGPLSAVQLSQACACREAYVGSPSKFTYGGWS
jgi:hypothetical protein